MNKFPIYLVLILLFASCTAEPPKPYGAVPSQAQVDWQKLEYYMFIHFGPNTFTNMEWGDGKEDPGVFNPTDLDCRQWAATAKAAGMKGIIITAKHHDGFCLWPSNYSKHTVRESRWKDGKGDVLKELSEACKEYGLLFGVYLSPWDQNHPDYGTSEYNRVFANTLMEIYDNYGKIFEQWFDGANGEGPDGKQQEYDWPLFHQVVYDENPDAIIFSDIGPGCRWVGNERGVAGETNWSTLNVEGYSPGLGAPPVETLNTGNMNGEKWVPAEVDVSIRPGWFYSPDTDNKVKTLEKLIDIYHTSIGRNANLLLNVPPDRRGRIHPTDSMRLIELRNAIDKMYEDNLAAGATVAASNVRGSSASYSAANVLNDDYDSYWAVDDKVSDPSIEIDLKTEKALNTILIQEYIPLGQRVSAFAVDYWDTGKNDWAEAAQGTTIGYKRILRFPEVTTGRVRIRIISALACPVINKIALYNAARVAYSVDITRDGNGLVTMKTDYADARIYYSIDNGKSMEYEGPFLMEGAATISAMAVNEDKKFNSGTVNAHFDIAPLKWKVLTEKGTGLQYMIDGDPHTYASVDRIEPVLIDLGETVSLKGFSYMPVNKISYPNIVKYRISLSMDGKNWEEQRSMSAFSNIKNNPVKQEVHFPNPVTARYLKLEALESADMESTQYTVADIGVITR